jgi:hypothetical protein
MKKIIVVVLIALGVFGGIVNAKVDQQVSAGVPLTEEYLDCNSCVQTVTWILFSLISGVTLLVDPEPLATWLGQIWTKRNNKLALRLLGIFLLALLPLNAYSLQNNCQMFCNLIPK